MKKAGRPPSRPTEEQIIGALQQGGGTITLGALGDRLNAPRSTIARRLRTLESAGLVTKVGQGTYQLPPQAIALPDDSRRVLEILDAAALDAHLTGLPPLLPFVHQFVRQFPQIVYADPRVLDVAEDELAGANFVISRLGGRSRIPAVDEVSRLVLLRSQRNAEQYGVKGNLATAEKAWVDLLRETHRGNVPMQFTELGRILRNANDAGINQKRLRAYARRMGYLHWIQGAMDPVPALINEEMSALREGFQS